MENFLEFNYYDKGSKLWIDWSYMNIDKPLFADDKLYTKALSQMTELESGAIANPDEKRMVGHYWLRNSTIAPTKEISEEIEDTIDDIKSFTAKVHSGEIKSKTGKTYKNALVIGIGGSNLGPKFIGNSLADGNEKIKLYFIDNTDPIGIDKTLNLLKASLEETLVIIISKSGGTTETRNGMVETQVFYENNGVDFFSSAICITQRGSKLENYGGDKWLKIFPMWDWVGGRTSVLSAVGLLPLSLQGIDCDKLIAGAKYCDQLTRNQNPLENPALILTKLWYYQSQGVGGTSMVMLPYRDSLELFSKYLQQLVMESLGKEKDLDGYKVNQGLAVYGNKGSTDQHSYVQQLIGGGDDMFVTFISVLKDNRDTQVLVGENSTSGDYLNAFMMGTEKALATAEKSSMTITVPEINEYYIGMLIALYERAVGFYGIYTNINPYHQPAVEFGKKAASEIIDIKNKIMELLDKNHNKEYSSKDIAVEIGCSNVRTVVKILAHLAENNQISTEGQDVFTATYSIKS